MIYGNLHEGSGLGDQLFRYITVRTLAEDKKLGWMMLNSQNFKGSEFLDVSMGTGYLKEYPKNKWNEKDVRDENGVDIRSYDPEINFVEDDTLIDGSFEDSKYWEHNLVNINNWLTVKPVRVPDDICLIGFRGGEYATQPDLFLEKDYWEKAIDKFNGKTFQVHTDDPILAKSFFGDCEVIPNEQVSHSKHTNMALNWRSMRYAKYAILPNSAFFILPRLLKHLEDPEAVTIAPRYWARRNTKTWARPACYYSCFSYI